MSASRGERRANFHILIKIINIDSVAEVACYHFMTYIYPAAPEHMLTQSTTHFIEQTGER